MTFRLSAVCLLLGVLVPQSVLAQGAEGFTDRIIVKFHESQQRVSALSARNPKIGASPTAPTLSLRHHRQLATGASTFVIERAVTQAEAKAIADEIAEHPNVAYAEPDRRMFPMVFPNNPPNDPLLNEQWNLGTNGMSLFDGVNPATSTPTIWPTTVGSSAVVVAVVDTGIVYHEDLDIRDGLNPTGQIILGYDFISSDPTTPVDFTENDSDPGRDSDPTDPGDWTNSADVTAGRCTTASDSSWHGSHIAGSIVATTNTGAIGMAGIAPGVTLLVVRALGKCGGYLSDVTDAMMWAAGLSVAGAPANSNPADVINLSLGGEGPCTQTEQEAINSINAAKKVVVVSAGNKPNTTFSPASCSGVINIGAVSVNKNAPSYNNSGPLIAVSAPGGAAPSVLEQAKDTMILSTVDSSKVDVASGQGNPSISYAYKVGTSMAAAQASGVIALMLSEDQFGLITNLPTELKPWQVIKRKLQTTAEQWADIPTSNCTELTCGAGVINAPRAVESPLAYAGDTLSVTPGQVNVTLQGYASDNVSISTTNWAQTGGVDTPTLSSTTDLNPTFVAPITPQNLEFQLTVSDGFNQTTDSVIVVVNGAPVLDPIGDRTVSECSALDFTVAATDPNGTSVIFSATGLPPGASLGTTNGRFFFEADQASQSSYQVTIFATDTIDANLKDSETFTIFIQASSSCGGGGVIGGGGAISSSSGGGGPVGLGVLDILLMVLGLRIFRCLPLAGKQNHQSAE